MSDPSGLVRFIRATRNLNQIPAVTIRPEFLPLASDVVANHRVSRIQNHLRRTIVLFEADDIRIGKILLEIQDIPQVRAAPPINALVVVPDHEDASVSFRKQTREKVLRPVGILVLVDQDVREPFLVLCQDLRNFPENLYRQHEQIVEIYCIVPLQGRLVLPIYPGDLLLVIVPRTLREGSRIDHPAFLGTDARPNLPWWELPLRDLLIPEHLPHQRKLVVGIVDGEIGVEACRRGLPPQNARAQGVKGSEPHAPGVSVQQFLDAAVHLPRCFVGERHGHDCARAHAADLDQVRKSVGQHARFSGPGPRQDENRAIHHAHRFFLLFVQPLQNGLHTLAFLFQGVSNRFQLRLLARIVLCFAWSCSREVLLNTCDPSPLATK